MQRGNVIPASTNPLTDFTGALAQNATAMINLQLDGGIAAGRHCRSIIRHLAIVSQQALTWEIAFFGGRSFNTSDLSANQFLSAFTFAQSAGKSYNNGAAPFYYIASNVDLPYEDLDFENQTLPAALRGGFLHVLLCNRHLTGKLAGAAGAIRITAYMEPTYG